MRRGNGEGSIFKLSGKRRKPWAVRITVGWTSQGKQQYKYVGYYSTKTEAKKALMEYLVDPYDLSYKSTKLIDVFEEWKKSTKIGEGTLKNYTCAFNQASSIHKMNMRDIKIIHLENAIIEMKPTVQKRFKNIMQHLYAHALKYEIVDRDISNLIETKTHTEIKEKTPFSLEEIEKIKAFQYPMNDIAIILLYTGMRIGELLEIETKNVNLEERYMIGGKKTKAGKDRVIPIHNEIFDLVKTRCENGHKYLITHKGKQLNYITYTRNYWERMLKILGKKYTPHATRHTFVSFADRCGINKTALKKIIGHKTSDITDHYTHKDKEELLKEINKLNYK